MVVAGWCCGGSIGCGGDCCCRIMARNSAISFHTCCCDRASEFGMSVELVRRLRVGSTAAGWGGFWCSVCSAVKINKRSINCSIRSIRRVLSTSVCCCCWWWWWWWSSLIFGSLPSTGAPVEKRWDGAIVGSASGSYSWASIHMLFPIDWDTAEVPSSYRLVSAVW
jgi:hypothetical protein